MKELFLDYEKQFTSHNGAYTICRGDYECLGAAMCAIEFGDDKMQKLADAIGLQIADEIPHVVIETWSLYNSGKTDELTDQQIETCDLFSERAFEIMETTAIAMGMRYYEDMTDAEYNEIILQTNK